MCVRLEDYVCFSPLTLRIRTLDLSALRWMLSRRYALKTPVKKSFSEYAAL
jgi:hypothetical protein